MDLTPENSFRGLIGGAHVEIPDRVKGKLLHPDSSMIKRGQRVS